MTSEEVDALERGLLAGRVTGDAAMLALAIAFLTALARDWDLTYQTRGGKRRTTVGVSGVVDLGAVDAPKVREK